MGKKGGADEPESSKLQAAIAEDLYSRTSPIRNQLIGMNEQFLGLPPQSGQSQGFMSFQGGSQNPLGGATNPNDAIRQIASQSQPLREQFVMPDGRPVPPRTFNGSMTEKGIQNTIDNMGLIERTAYQAQQQAPQEVDQAPLKPFDVSMLPGFKASKMAAEAQYGRAREGAISNIARGGSLDQALAGIEGNRAANLTGITDQLAQDQMNKAYGLATGTFPTTMQGLSGSSMAQAQAQQANAQQQGSMGQALGTVAAAAITKNPAGAAAGGSAGSKKG